MAKFLVLVKPRPSSPPPTQKKEFLKSGRNRVKLGSGGHRWAQVGSRGAIVGWSRDTTLFGPFYDLPRPILGDKTKFCQVKNRLVLVKRIAKEMCNITCFCTQKYVFGCFGCFWRVKTPKFCVFFLHFLVPKNPTQGSKFSRKKKFFFFRFFDFDKALAHTKCTGGTENGRGINSRCSKPPNSCFFLTFWSQKGA